MIFKVFLILSVGIFSSLSWGVSEEDLSKEEKEAIFSIIDTYTRGATYMYRVFLRVQELGSIKEQLPFDLTSFTNIWEGKNAFNTCASLPYRDDFQLTEDYNGLIDACKNMLIIAELLTDFAANMNDVAATCSDSNQCTEQADKILEKYLKDLKPYQKPFKAKSWYMHNRLEANLNTIKN